VSQTKLTGRAKLKAKCGECRRPFRRERDAHRTQGHRGQNARKVSLRRRGANVERTLALERSVEPQPYAAQVARIAASEAYDCLRAGGRVTLWAPGCEPSQPEEERNLLALLQWLARYPKRVADAGPPPLAGAAVAVTTRSERRLLDAVEDIRTRGGPVRAWVVGEAVLQSDIEVERTGLEWPPR